MQMNSRSSNLTRAFRLIVGFLVPSLFVALAVVVSTPSQAQTFRVIHNFAGADGAKPYAGLSIDRGGNLYGTASSGGYFSGSCRALQGCGTVFKLTRVASSWILHPLYTFAGGGDGATPTGRVTFGPDGALYGTTAQGGDEGGNCTFGCGTVFRLTPPASVCKATLCPWTETPLYAFQGGSDDAAAPGFGDVMFDPSGNLFGTTTAGGGGLCNDSTCGTVYKLTHSGSEWTESVLYRFSSDELGYWPYPGVILDNAGNVYGASTWNFSTVFELTPAGSGYSASAIYQFSNYSRDGSSVAGGLIFDRAGNIYGSTSEGGPQGGGTVFELSPSGGTWTLNTLYAFAGSGAPQQYGPTATLAMDPAGNLYGITNTEGLHGNGNVFKLTHSGSSWTYTSLYDFTGGDDGSEPYGQVVLDSSGNIYGTTIYGGANGGGVVFEITP